MYFTFLVITYNHESFILQHLESIKFQIDNYGEDYDFQLIISDDSSKDDTIHLIKKWININSKLFKSIKIFESDFNLGTCKNYIRGVENIEGDYFKALAGDDIYANDNIFIVVKLLEKYDIVSTAVAPFNKNKLYKDKKIYSRIYEMYKFTNTKYEKIRNSKISVPMTPGVFMKKELLTEDVLSFIEKYKFIEDRAQNIKIYEDNQNLKIGNYEKILVLYRHHDNAITKTKDSIITNEFNNDSRRLHNYVNKNSPNIIVKIKNKYNSFLSRLNNKNLSKIFNMGAFTYKLNFVLNYHIYKLKIEDIIQKSYLPNEKYLDYIILEVKKYGVSNKS